MFLSDAMIYAPLPEDPELRSDVMASRLSVHRRRPVHTSVSGARWHIRLIFFYMQQIKLNVAFNYWHKRWQQMLFEAREWENTAAALRHGLREERVMWRPRKRQDVVIVSRRRRAELSDIEISASAQSNIRWGMSLHTWQPRGAGAILMTFLHRVQNMRPFQWGSLVSASCSSSRELLDLPLGARWGVQDMAKFSRYW